MLKIEPSSDIAARAWPFVIALALLLPGVSLFEAAVRLIAFFAVWQCRAGSKDVWALVAIILLWSPALAEVGMEIIGSGPLNWLMENAFFFRAPILSQLSEITLTLGDLAIIGLCLRIALADQNTDRFVTYGASAFVVFIITCHAELLMLGRAQAWLEELSFLASWRIWVTAFLVSILIRFDDAAKTDFMRKIAVAGGILAFVVLVQHAVGDYSYVVDGWLVEEYFLRVRGTYSLHSDATLAMALATASTFFLMGKTTPKWWWRLAVPLLLVAAMSLNSTRAVSIGLLCGALVFATVVFLTHQRQIMLYLLPFLIIVVFSNHVFYNKAATLEPSVAMTESDTEDKEVFGPATGDRTLLLRLGLNAVLEKPFFGHGVGQVDLPLPGTAFFGALSTYSSHSFMIDFAAQVGIPATLVLLTGLGFVCIPLLRAAGKQKSAAAASGLALVATIGAVSIFFSETTDYLPLVFFALLGILATPQAAFQVQKGKVAPLEPQPSTAPRPQKAVAGILAAAAFIWAGANSPGIVLPAVGLVYTQLQEPTSDPADDIYTNSEALRRSLDIALWFRGDLRRSKLLPDDPETLPVTNAWILWDPTRDAAYPRIRDWLGYTTVRPIYPSPSFSLLPSWHVIAPKWWAEVSIIKAGTASVLSLPSEKLGQVVAGNFRDIKPDADAVFVIDTDLPLLSIQVENLTPSEGSLSARLEVVAGTSDPLTSSDEEQLSQVSTYTSGRTMQVMHVPDAFHGMGPLRLVLSSNSNIYSRMSASPLVTANLAPLARLPAEKNMRGGAGSVADYRWTTPWISSTSPHQITFDMLGITDQPLVIYGFSTIYYPINPTEPPIAWTVEGSDYETEWTIVDERSDANLQAGAGHTDIFIAAHQQRAFRFYRFTFNGSTRDKPLGLTDISLHFTLDPETINSTPKSGQ